VQNIAPAANDGSATDDGWPAWMDAGDVVVVGPQALQRADITAQESGVELRIGIEEARLSVMPYAGPGSIENQARFYRSAAANAAVSPVAWSAWQRAPARRV
jgi:hypothetical protein